MIAGIDGRPPLPPPSSTAAFFKIFYFFKFLFFPPFFLVWFSYNQLMASVVISRLVIIYQTQISSLKKKTKKFIILMTRRLTGSSNWLPPASIISIRHPISSNYGHLSLLVTCKHVSISFLLFIFPFRLPSFFFQNDTRRRNLSLSFKNRVSMSFGVLKYQCRAKDGNISFLCSSSL